MQLAEESLTLQAVAGDADALNRLLCHYDPQLRSRIKPEIGRLNGSLVDMDDVVQVTYVEAFLRISQFVRRGPGSFLAWLTQIALNNVKDAVRLEQSAKRPPPNKRIRPLSDESYANLLSRLVGPGSTPSRHIRRTEGRTLLSEAISKLPPDYKTVVQLYDLEGLPAQAVAESLERSIAAVHMLKARAHARLAELLNKSQFYGEIS